MRYFASKFGIFYNLDKFPDASISWDLVVNSNISSDYPSNISSDYSSNISSDYSSKNPDYSNQPLRTQTFLWTGSKFQELGWPQSLHR